MTGAFVAMAEMDKEVRKVMVVESVTINRVPINPTFPTTQPNLRYMITPRIVSKEGVKTPPKVPSLVELVLFIFLMFIRMFYFLNTGFLMGFKFSFRPILLAILPNETEASKHPISW